MAGPIDIENPASGSTMRVCDLVDLLRELDPGLPVVVDDTVSGTRPPVFRVVVGEGDDHGFLLLA